MLYVFLFVFTNQILNYWHTTLKILTMKNIASNINNTLYNNSDLLFSSYYDFSYNDSSLLFDNYHNSLSSNPPIFDHLPHDSPSNQILELYNDPSHDFSDLFLEEFELTQIGNEMIEHEVVACPVNETILRYDKNVNYQECDDSKYKDEEGNELKLHSEMEFKTWELAESYLKEYVK